MGNTSETEEHSIAERPAAAAAVYNISVAPPPLLKVHLGDAESLGRYVRTRSDALAVVWDETGLRVILRESSHMLTYRPEILPEAEQFFQREQNRQRNADGSLGPKIWEGEFEPVKFLRSDLRRFLDRHSSDLPADVVSGLSRLKLSDSQEESGDEGRFVQVSSTRSNFPSKFSVSLEVFPGVVTNLQFEAKPCQMERSYGRGSSSLGIELRCVNAREVLREAMRAALSEVPPEIPRFYGRSPLPSEVDRHSGF